MKTKFIISILTILISFFSCKEKALEKKQVVEKTSIVKKIDTNKVKSIKAKREYLTNVLRKIENMKHSDSFELNGGEEYKKNNTTIFLEIAEEIGRGNKIIFYSFKNILNNHSQYKFFLNQNSIILIVEKETKYDKIKETAVTLKQDTILFKENKIYHWKDKQATKEELLKKEKEILVIKKEIDSVLEW